MFLYHFIQMSLDCRTAYSRIATVSNHVIKLTERLSRIERSLTFDDKTAPDLVSFSIIKIHRILFHHILYYDNIIVVSIRSYHLLFYIKVYYIVGLLSLYNFFIFSMSSKSKLISVSEKTYHDLAEMGTLEDSFNSVIERMIQKQKAASGQQPLAGNAGQTTAAPLQPGGHNG